MTRHMKAVYSGKDIVGYDYWRTHKCERCGTAKEEIKIREMSGPMSFSQGSASRMHEALFAPFHLE